MFTETSLLDTVRANRLIAIQNRLARLAAPDQVRLQNAAPVAQADPLLGQIRMLLTSANINEMPAPHHPMVRVSGRNLNLALAY